MPLVKICRLLQICRKRIQRWQNSETLDRKQSERKNRPYNALTPDELELVQKMIGDKRYADDSCRVLSIKALEEFGIYISHVTFWEYMKSKGINGPRGIYAKRRNKHTKPDIGDVQEPNKLWNWDITHIKTTTRYKHYYLYVLQDWFSRKVVSWHLSESLASEEALTLWDKGILAEGLLNSEKPNSLSDRGTQMRSISTKLFMTSLGVKQLFSRPRTPNDNPKIEALFSTVKHAPGYPERFGSLSEAESYFEEFFDWYNYEHYHTGIGMVSPQDKHTGRDTVIFEKRSAVKKATYEKRWLYNVG